ncbi:MAG: XisI protein [Desulfobacterales bacterium]
MDKLEKYRSYITEIIKKYGSCKPSFGEVEVQTVSDRENDHYQILNIGWHNNKRVYGCSLHIDIKNGKIWIQHNGTEHRIARELTEYGVPKEDIVLAFHEPYRRQFTDYSVN